MKKVYIASSWKNPYHALVVELARALFGTEQVYDYRNPVEGDHGFSWREIDPEWEKWGAADFVKALDSEPAKRGFGHDMKALESADVCVLVLPSGKSAHLELGYAVGAGKKTAIFCPDPNTQPELMYKMADQPLLMDWQALKGWLTEQAVPHAPRAFLMVNEEGFADLSKLGRLMHYEPGAAKRPYLVYVAARSQHQAHAREVAASLRAAGVTVTSRWLEMNIFDFSTGAQAEGAAVDEQDIDRADALVLVNPIGTEKVGTGGCHYETGYAAAKGKQVFVLGPRSNVFHFHPRVKQAETVQHLIELLKQESVR